MASNEEIVCSQPQSPKRSGKDTPEYKIVRKNIANFINTVKSTKTQVSLQTQFSQRRWISVQVDSKTAEDLVTTALNRIENDSNEHSALLEMLHDIPELGQTEEKLKIVSEESVNDTEETNDESQPIYPQHSFVTGQDTAIMFSNGTPMQWLPGTKETDTEQRRGADTESAHGNYMGVPKPFQSAEAYSTRVDAVHSENPLSEKEKGTKSEYPESEYSHVHDQETEGLRKNERRGVVDGEKENLEQLLQEKSKKIQQLLEEKDEEIRLRENKNKEIQRLLKEKGEEIQQLLKDKDRQIRLVEENDKQVQRLLEHKDKELQQLREKKDVEIQRLLEEKDEEIQQLRGDKDKQIKQWRVERDEEIQRLLREKDKKIQQLLEEKDKEIRQLLEEKKKEIKRLREAKDEEILRLLEDNEKQVKRLREAKEGEIQRLLEEKEKEIHRLLEEKEKEIQRLREAKDDDS